MLQKLVPALILLCAASSMHPATAADAPYRQTESDAYTRYELLAPGSGKFRILYEVTATTPGARHYFNPIRKGSVATDERVVDRATGKPLRFDVVNGEIARGRGVTDAAADGEYIRVTLARPVPPAGGEARVLIDKTYADTKSYRVEGDTIVFDRSLGIKRNAVVLPPGYELLSCNHPAQVLQEPDGRIKISFWNDGAAPVPLVVRARRTADLAAAASSVADRLDERARQSREIVYYLRQPETSSFDLSHDYTETRPGVRTYTNVVRAGSSVTDPSARDLDTGTALRWQILKGEAIAKAGGDADGATPDTQAVVFHFAPPKEGESRRLRISETYTDPQRYRLVGDELVWDRSFGRPTNAVVLPAGWLLTNSSAPAAVTETADGRIRLDFINPRLDDVSVLITARRRAPGSR